MPTVLKSGILTLLETSGPVQVCNGIALPFEDYYPYDRLSSSRHRLLNLPDKRNMTLRWQSAGGSVRPAPIGQAGNYTPFYYNVSMYILLYG